MPPIQGRDLNSVVVSHSFAEHAWPGQDAVGKTLTRVNGQRQVIATLTVIGVAADVVEAARDPYAPARRAWYLSTTAGTYYDYAEITLAVRTRDNPAQFAMDLRRTLARLDPELAAARVLPMNARLAEGLSREQLSSFLYSLFAGCALLIALCSLYGALSFLVETRRQEFGVRLAIGAQPRQVMLNILMRSLYLAVVGIGIGIVLSIPALKLVGSLIRGTVLGDAWALMPLVAAMLTLALLAGFLPARRAARVDPIEALRHE